MRFLVLALLSISLTWAREIQLVDGIKPQKFPAVKLSNQTPLKSIKWEDIKTYVEQNNDATFGAGFIEANVTEFAQEIVKYASKMIVNLGLDPMHLSDEEISLFPGDLKLTSGQVEDLSTIQIIDSVTARYSTDTHILDITLPLSFKSMIITYDYKASILLVSVSGNVNAKVVDLKLNLHLGINFTNYHAFVDNIDIRNSGSIYIQFTGLGLLDWIIDILSDAVTALLHGLILDIVDKIIYQPVDAVVDLINEAVENILHPNATTTFLNLKKSTIPTNLFYL